jgi:hypothetical protein
MTWSMAACRSRGGTCDAGNRVVPNAGGDAAAVGREEGPTRSAGALTASGRATPPSISSTHPHAAGAHAGPTHRLLRFAHLTGCHPRPVNAHGRGTRARLCVQQPFSDRRCETAAGALLSLVCETSSEKAPGCARFDTGMPATVRCFPFGTATPTGDRRTRRLWTARRPCGHGRPPAEHSPAGPVEPPDGRNGHRRPPPATEREVATPCPEGADPTRRVSGRSWRC